MAAAGRSTHIRPGLADTEIVIGEVGMVDEGQDASVGVAIIGAGPYGLAIASHLKARGVAHVVYGRPMSSWREKMPKGMFLKSEAFASNIADPEDAFTLRRFTEEKGLEYADIGWPVPLDTFCDYGDWFHQGTGIVVDDVTVERVQANGRGFALSLGDGRSAEADQVVVAVGQTYFAYVPPELDALPAGIVVHSSHIADPAQFAGSRIAVIGGGSSALELGALLHEHGAQPTILARSTPTFAGPPAEQRPVLQRLRAPTAELCAGWDCWGYSKAQALFHYLPEARRRHIVDSTFGPLGGWWLRERVEGAVEVVTQAHLEDVEPGGAGVRLVMRTPDGTKTVDADVVVAATGYRPDIDAVPFLDAGIRATTRRVGGYPALTTRFETSVEGLYAVGVLAACSFGPSMRFVAGTRFTARRVAAALGSGRRSERRLPVAG
jgi:thioredoxin reductase